MFWWDYLNNTSYRQYIQEKYFSNNSVVFYCISFCSLCSHLQSHKVTFDIAKYYSSMSNITIHKLNFCVFCLWIWFWINIFTQIVSGIVCIVWDETFSICSSQTSQMDTGIGVMFQRTKLCSQFYCSGENTYRQY